MPTYSYHLPLRYNDSIRVLELSPGTKEDPHVHCNITRRRLSDQMLKYEAISYTWGDPLELETLFCGAHNAELSITRNCYNALRSLRLSNKARTIWVDAICINQNDILERSAQVRIMDRIYAAAFRVVAYLGEETLGSRLVFDELVIADSLYQLTGNFKERPTPSVELIHELDNLFCRPWFSRIWVIQEALMAEEVIIMCGRSHASMFALHECVFGYVNTRVTISSVPEAVRAAVSDTWVFSRTGDPATDIWQLLADTRNCGATDPRDKIFALKALLADGRGELEQFIDYGRSVERVFSDITTFLLTRVGLWLLLAVRHPHTLEMPSWVPDWSRNAAPHLVWGLGETPSANSREGFTICHVECSHKECTGQHAVLHVRGVQHSRISHLGALLDFNGAEELCFQVLRHFIPGLEKADRPLGLGHACGKQCHDVLPPPIFMALQRLKQMRRFELITGRRCSTHPDSDWTVDNEEIEIITTELQNRRFFLTENDAIGLAPAETCKDDVLCILRGLCWPSILRQRPENGWTLVSGDCHVTEEFDEYYFNEAITSEYFDDHGDREQEFQVW